MLSSNSTFLIVVIISIFANSIIAAPVKGYQVLPPGTASNCPAGTTKLDGQKSKDYICSPCGDNTFAGSGSAGPCIDCHLASAGTETCFADSSLAKTCKRTYWKDSTLHCLPCAGNGDQQLCINQGLGNKPLSPVKKITICTIAGQRLIIGTSSNTCQNCPIGRFTAAGNTGAECALCTTLPHVLTCSIDGTILTCDRRSDLTDKKCVQRI